jgi:O-acetylhomoserine/O-acetylserine sulfhydrylase-like pyridoxal-dependent enzyme
VSGDRRYRPETLAVHLGLLPDAETGAVVPPLHLATTFERDPDGDYPRGFVYARTDNPTARSSSGRIALLEGGREAAAFASGSAAAAVLRSVPPGATRSSPTTSTTACAPCSSACSCPRGCRCRPWT